MATAKLTARPRTESGKSAVRKLRSAGMIPAVIYGHGDETRHLVVPAHDLERLLATISVENTIVDLAIEGGATVPALIREVQYHSNRPIVYHVDFYQVHAGETLHVEVPIRINGIPVGVRDQSGVLQEALHTLSVECFPRDIPEAIDVDVSHLQVGESVHVSDIRVTNVKVLNDPEVVVATVTTHTPQSLPEGPETSEGIGGEVEPEVIRARRADAEDTPFERGGRQPE
jgi:large subunit ribosomal protein L25